MPLRSPRFRLAAIAAGLASLPLLLNGCGGGAEAQAEQLADACRRSSNIDQAVCECMGDKASRELSHDERAFVIAALNDDQAEADRSKAKLDLQGAMKAGMFMTKIGPCAKEAAKSDPPE